MRAHRRTRRDLSSLRETHAKYSAFVTTLQQGMYGQRTATRAIESTQQNEWLAAMRLFDDIASDDIKQRALDVCEAWCTEDMSPDSLSPTSSDVFPVDKYNHKTGEFCLVDAPACLTGEGYGRLASFHRATKGEKGVDTDDMKYGFLSRDMDIVVDKPASKGDDGKVFINGVDMLLSVGERLPESADATLPHVVATEPWYGQDARISEAYRHMEHNLSKYFYALFLYFKEHDIEGDALRKLGGVTLGASLMWICIEWLARSGRQRLRKASKASPQVIISAWMSGRPCAMPYWVAKWRTTMPGDYVKAVDVGINEPSGMGYIEWSRGVMAKQPRTDALRDLSDDDFVDVLMDVRTPFIEHKGIMPPTATNATSSTTAPIRVFLGLSAAAEIQSGYDLPHLVEFYEDVHRFLGARPGKRGKAVSKLTFDMSRLILATRRRVVMPVIPVKSIEGPVDVSLTSLHVDDTVALSCIAASRGVTPTEEAILSDILAATVDDLPSLQCVYTALKEAPLQYELVDSNNVLLRWLHFIRNPGCVEGYLRTCSVALGAAGYVQYEDRLKKGIDSNRELNADGSKLRISEIEEGLTREVLRHLRVPTFEEMKRDIQGLSNSKSSGADSVAIRSTKNIMLGERIGASDDRYQWRISKKKNAVVALCGDVVVSQVGTYSTADRPVPFATRSVPGRQLRWIYNVPLSIQIVLKYYYVAMKEWMKHHANPEMFVNITNSGKAYSDCIDMVSTSIKMMLPSNCIDGRVLEFVCADDASRLDQHKAHRFHAAQCNVLREFAVSMGDCDVRENVGKSYFELLHDAIQSYDNQFFYTKKGSKMIQLRIDSDPSGALNTTESNSICNVAAMQLMEELTGTTGTKYCWGDDSYSVLPIRHDMSAVELIQARVAAGKEAGQDFGTLDGAILGRSVDFLKKVAYAGQMIARRSAIDNERPVDSSLGDINSICDKYTMMSQRGGNLTFIRIWTSITCAMNSKMTIFGKEAVTDFTTMTAPGGMNSKTVWHGYPLANSRLWMTMNWRHVCPTPDEASLMERPRMDTDDEVGRRMFGGDVREVKYEIGGRMQSEAIDDRIGRVSDALMVKDVGRNAESAAAALNARGTTWNTDLQYSEWVKNSQRRAMGGLLVKYYGRDAKEKALIKAGYVSRESVKSGKAGLTMRKMRKIPEYEGTRIGRYTVAFSYVSSSYLSLHSRVVNGVTRYSYKYHFSPRTDPIEFPFRWHPFWSRAAYMRHLASLFGMTVRGGVRGLTDIKGKFSPSAFRPDLSVDDVVRALTILQADGRKEGKSHTDVVAEARLLLAAIGFDKARAHALSGELENLHLYADLEDADKYTGLDPMSTSFATDRIDQMLAACAQSLPFDDRHVMSVVRAQFVSLLTDEFNVEWAKDTPVENMCIYVPVPRVDVVL
jgi:hypothetical protein